MKRLRFSPKTWLLSVAAGAALTPGFVLLSRLHAADPIHDATPIAQPPDAHRAEEQLQAAVQRELSALYEERQAQQHSYRITARSALESLREKGERLLNFRPRLPMLGRSSPPRHITQPSVGVPKPGQRRRLHSGASADSTAAAESTAPERADSRPTAAGPTLRQRPRRFLDRMLGRESTAPLAATEPAVTSADAVSSTAAPMPLAAEAPEASAAEHTAASGTGAVERELQALYERHGMQAPSLDPRIALQRLKQSVQPPAHQIVVPDRRAPHASGSIIGRLLPTPQAGHGGQSVADDEPIVIRKPIRLVDLLGIPREPHRTTAIPGPAQPPVPDDLAETIADQVVAKLQQRSATGQVAAGQRPATPILPVPESAGELPAVPASNKAPAEAKPLRLASDATDAAPAVENVTSPAAPPLPEAPAPAASRGPAPLDAPPALQPAEEPALQPAKEAADTELDPQTREKLRRIAERQGRAGLKGFCPVALRDRRELQDAQLQFHSTYRGKTYFFSSADAKAKFDANPAAYAPAYDGLDPVLLKNQKQKRLGVLDYAVWYHNRLYLFASPETMATFTANPSQFAVDEQGDSTQE